MTASEFPSVSRTPGVTLTDYEIDALSRSFNFADGHARYSIAQHSSSIMGKFPQLLTRTYNQDEVEHNFGNVFFSLAGQSSPGDERILYCPSASISIELAANYLRMNNLSASRIEPIFDNLADREHARRYGGCEAFPNIRCPYPAWQTIFLEWTTEEFQVCARRAHARYSFTCERYEYITKRDFQRFQEQVERAYAVCCQL
jgi:hypothetical protein